MRVNNDGKKLSVQQKETSINKTLTVSPAIWVKYLGEKKPKEKSEPMNCACSTNWTMKPHVGSQDTVTTWEVKKSNKVTFRRIKEDQPPPPPPFFLDLTTDTASLHTGIFSSFSLAHICLSIHTTVPWHFRCNRMSFHEVRLFPKTKMRCYKKAHVKTVCCNNDLHMQIFGIGSAMFEQCYSNQRKEQTWIHVIIKRAGII